MTKILRSKTDILKTQDKSSLLIKHFVPTMGSLHKGHISLIEKAKKNDGITFVSIFINPIQFDNQQDFLNYPEKTNKDIEVLKELKVDYVFIPKKDVFISDSSSLVNVNSFENILCAKDRPNHFNGVATIITKFLNLINPHYIYLGEKDYQQILVVKKIIKDFSFRTKVRMGRIIREHDGLAFSSRNSLLTRNQREKANQLYTTLRFIKKNISLGNFEMKFLELIKKKLLENGFDKINYLEIRRNEDLSCINGQFFQARVFISATIGNVRLIDNLFLGKIRKKKTGLLKIN